MGQENRHCMQTYFAETAFYADNLCGAHINSDLYRLP